MGACLPTPTSALIRCRAQAVAAPMGDIPGGSALRYEIEVLRLSFSPDELTRGISNCGIGGASAQSSGCAAIVASE